LPDAKRTMRLGTILQTGGQHIAAWRRERGIPHSGVDFEYYTYVAKVAERGTLDFVFIADVSGLRDWPIELVCRTAFMSLSLEPITLVTAMSAVTENVGFVATGSTSFPYPYTLARRFATLDVISGGRAGWNIVTSVGSNEALNYGITKPREHGERYEIAAEFVEIVQGLWDSVEPDVVIGDKAAGVLFDSDKIHRMTVDGRYNSVDGVLTVPPSKQGRPARVQAGASGPGRDLAASVGEVIFGISPQLDVARDFYDDIHARMEKFGRADSEALILVGLIPVIADTEEEAVRKVAELDAGIHPDIALGYLSDWLGGVDLSAYPLDGPLPDDLPVSDKSKAVYAQVYALGKREGMSIRQLGAHLAARMTHLTVTGTATQVADTMEEWFQAGVCDGFLMSGSLMPEELEMFVDQVVPILRDRGLFRKEYESSTLRGNLGLDS
jgi:N-acetyl-S-(2-succino)cysteine monooxygenase